MFKTAILLDHRFRLVLLIAVIALFLATTIGIGARLHQDWLLAHHKEIKVPVVFKNKQYDGSAALIETLANSHLFGQTMTAVGNMPLSNLQLSLTGIVHSNSGSKAYITIASQPAKIYATGDELPFGAKIYAITADTVILQNEGRLEKLTLARAKLKFKLREKAGIAAASL